MKDMIKDCEINIVSEKYSERILRDLDVLSQAKKINKEKTMISIYYVCPKCGNRMPRDLDQEFIPDCCSNCGFKTGEELIIKEKDRVWQGEEYLQSYSCPKYKEWISKNEGFIPKFCPHCGVKIKFEKGIQ
jgi:DNA-directed RNA polymerase subunit RPC12/RpoP